MAFSYKASISFGLVYIPVTLHAVVKNSDIGFNMLHRPTGSRIKYRKTCPECGDADVAQKDIVKGFEYEKGRYVIFEDEDFERIKTERDKNITILQFTDLSSIDPIYYDRAFYVKPEGGDRAYMLLCAAMREENKAGIARTVLGNKECMAAIREKDGQMLLSTMFFYENIQPSPVQALPDKTSPQELALAKSIIASMSADYQPQDYADEYKQRLSEAIAMKVSGQQIVVPKMPEGEKIMDLMAALEQSLRLQQGGAGAH